MCVRGEGGQVCGGVGEGWRWTGVWRVDVCKQWRWLGCGCV